MTTISLQGISKSFGKVAALSEINLEILSGELFFLLGPSGCGKSTILRVIAGFEKPDSGKVLFDQVDITETEARHRGVGFVFQNYALWPHMTVKDNISFGLEVQKLSKETQLERIDQMLKLVKLTGLESRYPHQLSGGQQQRLAIARALAIQPKVLLMDEPVSNLDKKLRLEIRDELKELHSRLKLTIVYVTHDIDEALALNGRVALMEAGKIVKLGAAASVLANN